MYLNLTVWRNKNSYKRNERKLKVPQKDEQDAKILTK